MNLIGAIIVWALCGLVAGAIARMLHPGRDAMGWGGTMLLGVMGSLLGGAVAYLLGHGTSPLQGTNMILSVIGAIVLLSLGFFTAGRRTTI
jgi:uncharacterized membrane protein YeaQ/YmgE (transglycosylase-associated protein family)